MSSLPFLMMPFAIGLLAGVVVFLEIGRRIARRRLAKNPSGLGAGFGPLEGAIFGLMGLLLAFTFSGAASRFDARRHLIVEEANAIGTAYLRLDMLPSEVQPKLREDFRRYLDARLAAYRKIPDIAAAKAELARSVTIQEEIWAQAVAACRSNPEPQPMMVVLPALNTMFDIANTRTVASQMHPPTAVYLMLAAMVLAASLFAGHGMGSGGIRSWLHIFGFAIVVATTVYIILDYEYPRIGFIRVDAVDQVLVDVRASMK